MKKYLILLLFTFQGLMAQVQFEARVSKNTLGLNERLRIDFIMNVDGDNFEGDHPLMVLELLLVPASK